MGIISLVLVGVVAFVFLNHRITQLSDAINGKTFSKSPQPEPVTSVTPSIPAEEKQNTYSVSTKSTTPSVSFSEEEGGRWLGKIGILAVVIGISFFLKYAFEENLIDEVGRVIIGIVAGIILLGCGRYLRKKYARYAEILMGGGIAVLYLTIFAAHTFYHIIDSSAVAFFFVALVTALSVVISLVDGTVTLAALGVFGAFLTPYLISFGKNDFESLFTYIALINIGVLVLSFKERWYKLNYLAFLGTVFTFATWFFAYYDDKMQLPVMFFATIYFLIFLVMTVAHNLIRQEKTEMPDVVLVTVNALGYLGINYAILDQDIMGFFSVVLALVYMLLSFVAYQRNKQDTILNFYLPGLAVVFLSIAIPLQLTGYWITLAWLVEAVVLFCLARVGKQPSIQIFGMVVYMLGIVRFFAVDNTRSLWGNDYTVLLNERVFLLVVMILVSYGIARIVTQKIGEGTEATQKAAATLVVLFVMVANFLSLFLITTEIDYYYQKNIGYVEQALDDHNNQYQNSQYDSQDPYGSYNLNVQIYDNRSNEYKYDDESEVQYREDAYKKMESIGNERNTAVTIAWALYAAILLAFGFARHSRFMRIAGLILFFATAIKIFIDVWDLGPLYQIASSIAFGIIALVASFLYARFKHRLKEIL